MPGWEGSTRRSRLPRNWAELRKHVLQRDNHQCQWYMDTYYDSATNDTIVVSVCNDVANEVDHIIPNDDHSLSNLRSLCKAHHQRKSSIEGAKALAAKRKAMKRKTETHPGLL
jgi:5-methylcytosine-specific restriction protein A